MAVLRFLYALYLRLTGLGLLAVSGAYLFLHYTEVPVPQVELWVPATLAVIGFLFFVPFLLPRGLRRPREGRDLVWLAAHAIIALVYPKLEVILPDIFLTAMAQIPQFDLSQVPPEAMVALRTPVEPIWWVIPPFALMLLMVLPSLKPSRRPGRPDPKDPARAIPIEERKPVPLPVKRKLPALGFMMTLYIVVDWLILRLLGLGLLATAYMMWTLISTGNASQAALLAHGQDTMTALYVYAGVGALMTLPFFLPRAIIQPRSVLGGLLKAILLVGSAYVLLQPMEIAIRNFTPSIYHDVLVTSGPKLFKAICGVAVTATLLISFFRQLAGLPAVDYKGDPKLQLSSKQLHALRKART